VAAKEGLELRHAALSHQDAALMLIGMLTSAIVGYAVIRFFLRFLSGHRWTSSPGIAWPWRSSRSSGGPRALILWESGCDADSSPGFSSPFRSW
jgi:hypothetical protein